MNLVLCIMSKEEEVILNKKFNKELRELISNNKDFLIIANLGYIEWQFNMQIEIIKIIKEKGML